MSPEQFEEELLKVAAIQREAGWSERSIKLYAIEKREMIKGSMECTLMIGAGLACDNTRFGVPNPKPSTSPADLPPSDDDQGPFKAGEQLDDLTLLREILGEVFMDSGFRNLCDTLQGRIEQLVNR